MSINPLYFQLLQTCLAIKSSPLRLQSLKIMRTNSRLSQHLNVETIKNTQHILNLGISGQSPWKRFLLASTTIYTERGCDMSDSFDRGWRRKKAIFKLRSGLYHSLSTTINKDLSMMESIFDICVTYPDSINTIEGHHGASKIPTRPPSPQIDKNSSLSRRTKLNINRFENYWNKSMVPCVVGNDLNGQSDKRI